MQYFIKLAYNGHRFNGWQTQPNGNTVQDELQRVFSTILATPIEIVGCGRTDSGVHASAYIAHFEFKGVFPRGFLNRANKFLHADVVLYAIYKMPEDAHARFGADSRSYEYHLHRHKSPFHQETAYHFPFFHQLDFEKMNQLTAALVGQHDFESFCKTHSGNDHFRCTVTKAQWDESKDGLVLNISANRFVRGMVRLIVGASLNVGIGKTDLEETIAAFRTQKMIPKSYSAPPNGLFLTTIAYPYPLDKPFNFDE